MLRIHGQTIRIHRLLQSKYINYSIKQEYNHVLIKKEYHLHVKMIDLTKVCMLFLMNHWHAIFQMLLLKKWRWNLVNLFWDWCEWQGAVNMVRNIWIPWNAVNLLNSWETCSFSRTTVLLAVCQFLCSEPFGEKLFSSVFCLLFCFLCLVYIFFFFFFFSGNWCLSSVCHSRKSRRCATCRVHNSRYYCEPAPDWELWNVSATGL